MNNLSQTQIRRWSTLIALLFVATAALFVVVAAINPALLNILQHPRDDIFLITGYLIVAVLVGSLLLFSLFLPPKDDDTDVYEPEATPEIPYAGTDIEPLTKNPLLGYRVTSDEQDAIRGRLRDAAVNIVHRHTGIGTGDARSRVRHGDWTDNAAAAWFLGETPPPRSVRLYARISDDLAFRHGARQTVHEIVAYEQRHGGTEGDAS